MKEDDIKLIVLLYWLGFSLFIAINNLLFADKIAKKALNKYRNFTENLRPVIKRYFDFLNWPFDDFEVQVKFLKFMGFVGIFMAVMAMLVIFMFLKTSDLSLFSK